MDAWLVWPQSRQCVGACARWSARPSGDRDHTADIPRYGENSVSELSSHALGPQLVSLEQVETWTSQEADASESHYRNRFIFLGRRTTRIWFTIARQSMFDTYMRIHISATVN